MCFKTPRLETQLLSLNSSSVSPRPAASGLEDARQPAQPQAGSNLAGPAGENPEHSAGSPRASPRLGAEGEPGRRKGQPGPSSAQLARRPRGEWQRRRARCQRRGAEPRALVGAGSEAGRAGRGRRRGRCRALELRARGEESRAAGAELEEAAAYGWQRVGDGELGSRTAGGSELGQGLIGAVRARGCRCSLGPAEEGSRPAGEVQLACGVPRSSQATDGQRDESVRKDRASPGASAWSRRVDESLKRKPVGGPRPQRRRALT
ncbi:unnamed protein product [Rangifer tarandus platyrhynchus]|uniref:Uncharacterized protein n=2 Tax=Rangifer tarandus platyrhynchus TaxID=3082113 RepID=A0ABN8Y922_RANTA|nr:unnamed protein product [Rangifer tarandus platyrhynchus]